MGGLLYKDYVTTCRKNQLVLLWTIATVAFAALEMLLPRPKDVDDIYMVFHMMLVMIYCCFPVMFIFSINSFVTSITDGDDRTKMKAYLKSLPITRGTYIASKYIFIAIATYVLLSIGLIWSIFASAYPLEGMLSTEMCTIGQALLLPAACVCILAAAIELPFFILFGKEKAFAVKISILVLLFFVAVGILLFADLSCFEGIVIFEEILRWMGTHTFEITLFDILSPVIALGLYFLSYKITCKLAEGREW